MLVTGGTGVVGTELVARATAAGWDVASCSRRGGPACVPWDMSAEPAPATLRRRWDVVVHTAAQPRHWTRPTSDAWRANVAPLEHLDALVGADTHLVLVSTAYATGTTGAVDSAVLDDYRNSYEWSKAAAERVATDMFGPTTVVRPPLIIGRRTDGSIARFFGMYTILLALTTSMLPVLVAEPGGYVDLVSTTDVADCCLALALGGRPAGTTVHTLGRGAEAQLNSESFDLMLEALNTWRLDNGHEPLVWPRYINREQWDRFFRPFAERRLNPSQLRIIDRLEPFVPYMNIQTPLQATWPVPPMADCLKRSVTYWAERNRGLASRSLIPWAADPSPADRVAR